MIKQLYLFPLNLPATLCKCACFSFPVFPGRRQRLYASMEWTPLQTRGESLGMDAPP